MATKYEPKHKLTWEEASFGTRITGWGYKGRLPGSLRRMSKAQQKARALIKLVNENGVQA